MKELVTVVLDYLKTEKVDYAILIIAMNVLIQSIDLFYHLYRITLERRKVRALEKTAGIIP